jgi:hypothetical protein
VTPKRQTKEKMETSMADAIKPFEQYIECLAQGKLDGYLDSNRRGDKVSVPNMTLATDPNLLLHDLGKQSNLERIKKLFVKDTVYVVSIPTCPTNK